MNTITRLTALALVILLSVAAIIRLSLDDVAHRVDLHAVVEIWSDVIRDMENVPLTITRMSDAEEMALGDKLHKNLGFRLRDDVAEIRYLSGIGQRLAEHAQRQGIRYHFHVIEHWRINAHALPGGHVYVTRGMLAFVEDEAELASIIGHEISHIDLRHCVQQFQYQRWAARLVGEDRAVLTRFVRRLFSVGFSEQQEIEADARGMVMAAAADYDPGEAIAVEGRLLARRPEETRVPSSTVTGELADAVAEALGEYFETHPTGARRISALRAVYRRNAPAWRGKRFYVGRSNFLDSISLAADARDNEWVGFRELDSLGPHPGVRPETPPLEARAPAEPVVTPEVDVKPVVIRQPLHPVNQWNVAARDVVVRREPRNDIAEVTSLKTGDDVFVAARVGFTSWLRVRIRHSGRLWIGYLLEQDLLRPVAHPERTENKPWMMDRSVKDICVGLRYGNPDYVEEAKRRRLTIETCQQLGH